MGAAALKRDIFAGDANDTQLDPAARRHASEEIESMRQEFSGHGVPVVDFGNGIRRFVSGVHRQALMRMPFHSRDKWLEFTLSDTYNMLLWWFAVDADKEAPRRAGAASSVTTDRQVLLQRQVDKMVKAAYTPKHWIQTMLRPTQSSAKTPKTFTSPMLLPCELVRPKESFLLPLLDYRTKVMIKMQPLTRDRLSKLEEAGATTLANPLIGFTLDVLYGRLLRELTTRWPRVVTIHFATCIEAFVAPAFTVTATERIEFKPHTDPHLYQVTEHAETMLNVALYQDILAMKAAGETDIPMKAARRLAGWTWQLYYSAAASATLLQLNLIDPHASNVMVSPAEGRPYHQRVLAYRLRGARTLGDLVYLTPEDYGGQLVDIIDFGISEPRTTAEERDQGPLSRELLASKFIDDMLLFLTRGEVILATLTRAFDGDQDTAAHLLVLRTIAWLHKAKKQDPVSSIFEKWPRMPMFEHLIGRDFSGFSTAAGDQPPPVPLLVGYMPDDEEVAETAEMRPPHSLSCMACGFAAATSAAFSGARLAEGQYHNVAFHCDNLVCAAVASGQLDAVKPRAL